MHASRRHFDNSPFGNERTFKISVVRHPWGRALSGFYHSRYLPGPAFCSHINSRDCEDTATQIESDWTRADRFFGGAPVADTLQMSSSDRDALIAPILAKCEAHNADVKVKWAEECGVFHNELTDYLSTKTMLEKSSGFELIDKVLEAYDLIAVTERLHESLVVMKHLLGLSYKDLLYYKAKSVPVGFVYNSPQYKGHSSKGKARVQKLAVADEPAGFKDAVMKHNVLDMQLYQAAVFALDNHIAQIGNDTFQSDLQTYNKLQAGANRACGTIEAANMTVTSFDGRRSYNPRKDCYWEDNGCAIECLDIFYDTIHRNSTGYSNGNRNRRDPGSGSGGTAANRATVP